MLTHRLPRVSVTRCPFLTTPRPLLPRSLQRLVAHKLALTIFLPAALIFFSTAVTALVVFFSSTSSTTSA